MKSEWREKSEKGGIKKRIEKWKQENKINK